MYQYKRIHKYSVHMHKCKCKKFVKLCFIKTSMSKSVYTYRVLTLTNFLTCSFI